MVDKNIESFGIQKPPPPKILTKPLPAILDDMEANIKAAAEAARRAEEASRRANEAAKSATQASTEAEKWLKMRVRPAKLPLPGLIKQPKTP